MITIRNSLLIFFCTLLNFTPLKAPMSTPREAYDVILPILDIHLSEPILIKLLSAVFVYKYFSLKDFKGDFKDQSEQSAIFAQSIKHTLSCEYFCLAACLYKSNQYLDNFQIQACASALRNKFIDSIEEGDKEALALGKAIHWLKIFQILLIRFIKNLHSSEVVLKTVINLTDYVFGSYLKHRKLGRSHSFAMASISRELSGSYGSSIFKNINADPYLQEIPQ